MTSLRITIVSATLAFTACTSGSGDLDTYLAGLAHLPSDPTARTEGPPGAPVTQDHTVCVTQPIHETRQHDEVVALAANSAAMWPGALLRGDSVYTGLFTPIALARAPMTFSMSLENLAGTHSATLESPSLSAYREAIASILAQTVTGSTPANISVDIERIDSQQQVALALGAGATWNGLVDVKASFDWSAQSKKSRYLVKFVQSYYTVDVDPPSHPAAVFDPSVGLADVQAVTGADNPPVYVSSITYGRMVVFTFESDTDEQELGAAVEALYRGPGAASGMLSAKDQTTLVESRISAYVLGGSGGAAVKAIDGIDALLAFIRDGGDYSPASPGAPIAYKLAHLSDNEPARLSFTDDYQVKSCTATSGTVQVTLETIQLDGSAGELDGTLEVYGVVTVSTTAGAGAVLVDRDRSQYVTLGSNETWPSTGTIARVTVPVDTAAGAFLEVFANLSDADAISDDWLGNASYRIDLDGGWTRDFQVVLTGSGRRLLLHVTTQPL